MFSVWAKYSIAAIVPAIMAAAPGRVYSAVDFIKSIKLENASINDVAALLHKKYGWNVVLADEKSDIYKSPGITLEFTQVPVWALVKYSCMATGLKYRFDDNMILIGKNVEELKEYYPSDYKPKSKLDNIPYGTRMSIGTIYYFPVNYIPPQIIVSNNGNTITYASPMPVFQRLDTGVVMATQDEPPPKIFQEEQRKRTPEMTDELTGAPFPLMESKLYDLKIDLDLEQVSLREAVNAIHKLSIQADPKKAGINFYIKLFPGMDDIRVDIILTNFSIHRILQYICESSNLKYHAAPYVVVIYNPQNERKSGK
jgi:hypothetical protein